MKKRPRQPRFVSSNPVQLAMMGASLLAKADQTHQGLATRAAIDNVVEGRRSVETWRVIFDMTNLIEELCKNPRVVERSSAASASSFVDSVQTTIVAILDRQRDGGKALYASEIAWLNDAHALFVDLLAVITYRDLFQAQAGISARVRRALHGREPGITVVEASA